MSADYLAIKKIIDLRALMPRPCLFTMIGARGSLGWCPEHPSICTLQACSLGAPALKPPATTILAYTALQGLAPEGVDFLPVKGIRTSYGGAWSLIRAAKPEE